MKTRSDPNKYYLQGAKGRDPSPYRICDRRHQTEYSITTDASQTMNKLTQETTSPKLQLNRRAPTKLSLRLPKVQRFLDTIHVNGSFSSPLNLKNQVPQSSLTLTTIKSERERTPLKIPVKNTRTRKDQKFHSQTIDIKSLLKRDIKSPGSSKNAAVVNKKLKKVGEIAAATNKITKSNRDETPERVVHTEGSALNMNDFQLQLIDLRCNLEEESDRRTLSSATFTGASNTPTFAFNRSSNLKSFAAQFTRKTLEETPVCEDLSESFYEMPNRVYVFQANQNAPRLNTEIRI